MARQRVSKAQTLSDGADAKRREWAEKRERAHSSTNFPRWNSYFELAYTLVRGGSSRLQNTFADIAPAGRLQTHPNWLERISLSRRRESES